MSHVKLIPAPAPFVRSIAEQGYTLSTALADLIDNSITAGATRVEILFNKKKRPFQLLVADNGMGMSSDQLEKNMQFPSNDMELVRAPRDLGRFGLGLKTASFSQAKKFTVISRKDKKTIFSGRTWDLEYLKKNGWALIVNSEEDNKKCIDNYFSENLNYHNQDSKFTLGTLIIWENLYKIIEAREQEIEDELREVSNHLALVFHRFLENRELVIRLNNEIIKGYNPFPVNQPDIQKVTESFWKSGDNYITFQGIILPKKAIEESKTRGSIWTLPGKSLFDLEGIFVYRNRRIIYYGSWLRARQKSNLLRLGRVKIDINNVTDALFHLNVAKSSLRLPFGLRKAMSEMIQTVELQAMKEYREKVTGEVLLKNNDFSGDLQLMNKVITGKGAELRLNPSFLLIRQLLDSMEIEDKERLILLLKLIESKLNEVLQIDLSVNVAEDEEFTTEERAQIEGLISYFSEAGLSKLEIENWLLVNICKTQAQRMYIKSLI